MSESFSALPGLVPSADGPSGKTMDTAVFNGLMEDTVLRDLLQSIYAISGLRISLSTCQGDRVLAVNEYITPFCKFANDIPALHELCVRCSRCGGERAAERKTPYIYRCYAGLACAAIPVFTDGTYAATLITSGFRVEKEYMNVLEQICPEESHRVPDDVISSATYLHFQRVQDIANLLSVAARYIAEASLRNQIQAELHEKTLELMRQQQVQLNTEKLLSQAEFKALQSQINPHFLFNTLNAVSQLALLEGSSKTADAIFSLSALLRRCLKRNDTLPPLREEVDNISEYINIKKLLYRDRIRYIQDIDRDCLSLRVPLFTLQPLVENALLHGLEPKEDGGTLTLSIQREGKFVVIHVEDDGMGCVLGANDRAPGRAQNRNRSDLTGIGLDNVTSRLSNHFGPAFHWTIDSAPGQGTRVALYLPDEKEE